jgi:hypothetical protein
MPSITANINANVNDCLRSWIEDADLCGGRAEALRCAEKLIRDSAADTSQIWAALEFAVRAGTITMAEANEMFGGAACQ